MQSLVNHAQVDAVAVVGRFPDEEVGDLDDYRQGKVLIYTKFLLLCDAMH